MKTEVRFVLFENGRLIAVDKPAGVLVIPDQYTDASQTLVGRVSAVIGAKAWVVHRIDRDTTGVVLFAKDPEAHAFLCRQFEAASVKKKYLALVNGIVKPSEGEIRQPILTEGRKVSIDSRGKEAVTRYRVLERFRDLTLLEVFPRTGRRHQIRIHFASSGHPLAVDPEYRSRESLYLSEFKRAYKPGGQEKPLISRLTLHAASVTFTDPVSQDEITVESPLPRDFEITLKQIRKYDR